MMITGSRCRHTGQAVKKQLNGSAAPVTETMAPLYPSTIRLSIAVCSVI